jgi:hypothetical protein
MSVKGFNMLCTYLSDDLMLLVCDRWAFIIQLFVFRVWVCVVLALALALALEKYCS